MPAVAFDFLGTLFSFDKVIVLLMDILAPEISTRHNAERFFYDWMCAALRDYFGASHSGRYCPLSTILRATLGRACLMHGYPSLPTADQIDRIMNTFGDLELAPSALEALRLLKEKNWDIWIVTNGSYEHTVAMLEKHAITDYFRLQITATATTTGRTIPLSSSGQLNLLCCDDLGVSKPHPKVYSELMRMEVHRTQKIENFYLISSHAWDLAGAKNVSFRTVFLTSEEKTYPKEIYNDIGPDLQANTIIDCVKAMFDLESEKGHFL